MMLLIVFRVIAISMSVIIKRSALPIETDYGWRTMSVYDYADVVINEPDEQVYKLVLSFDRIDASDYIHSRKAFNKSGRSVKKYSRDSYRDRVVDRREFNKFLLCYLGNPE